MGVGVDEVHHAGKEGVNITTTDEDVIDRHSDGPSDRYKWVVLTNTTAGVLIATIDSSIVIIAMPAIFRGIHLDPLGPGNSFYLLWMMLGYLIVTSVLVVSFGRIGDMFGRVRMYNLGFLIFTVASVLLSVDWMTGPGRGDLAHRHAHRPGRRRGVHRRQLRRHHHRHLPGQPAGTGARDQQRGQHRRPVPRPGRRRGPGHHRLAAGVLRVGAVRHLRHAVGLLQAGGARRPPAGADRLGRQRHLRRRPGPGHGRDHLRDPALRRARHGLDESQGHRRARPPAWRSWPCSR